MNEPEAILIHLKQALLTFIKILDNERLILEQNNLVQLEEILIQKQVIINEINNDHSTLSACLGQDAEQALNMDEWMATPPKKDPALLTEWQSIQQLLKECSKKNFTNGIIITTLKNCNDAILRVLTRRAPINTYTHQVNPNMARSESTREHKV